LNLFNFELENIFLLIQQPKTFGNKSIYAQITPKKCTFVEGLVLKRKVGTVYTSIKLIYVLLHRVTKRDKNIFLVHIPTDTGKIHT